MKINSKAIAIVEQIPSRSRAPKACQQPAEGNDLSTCSQSRLILKKRQAGDSLCQRPRQHKEIEESLFDGLKIRRLYSSMG
jgi:hypothetical protein